MPEEFIPLAGFTALAAIFMTIAVQLGGVFRTRATSAHEAEYRRLVQEATDAQRRVSESLDRAVAEIAALRTRAESMERLLQEVG